MHSLGAVLQLQGRWPESVDALNESIRLCREFGVVFGDVLGNLRIAQIETAVGQLDSSLDRLRMALALARDSNSPMVRAHSLGRVYSSLTLNRYEAGDLKEATRYLARGLATQKVVGECAGCDALLYPAAVPIYIAHNDLKLAEDACVKAGETASAFRSKSWIGTYRYLMGLLAEAREDWSTAESYFREVVEIFDSLQQPFDLARGLEKLGQVVGHTSGEADNEASPILERTISIYADLGSPYRVQRVRHLLESLS